VRVKLPASMQELMDVPNIVVSGNPITTVAELLEHLATLPKFKPLVEAYKRNPRALIIIGNGRRLSPKDRLDACDDIWLFYPAKGGS